MENSGTGAADAILSSKTGIQHRPRADPIIDATDLSDTTESEAEKHGCMYSEYYLLLFFLNLNFHEFFLPWKLTSFYSYRF